MFAATAIHLRRAGVVFALALAVTAGAGGPRAATRDPLTLFAAASTADAVAEAIELFAERRGIQVRASYAASSTLARQIEAGASAHVYLSASSAWIDYLVERRLVDGKSRRLVAGNRLVLVAPRASSMTLTVAPGFLLAEALEGGRLALGDPAHVPAGIYARAALHHLGIWERIAPRLAPAANVRAALAMVARGEAAAGIVYASDARITNRVRIVAVFPEASHPPIRYEAVVVTESDVEAGRALLDFLAGAEAGAVFLRHGFRRP